MEVLGSTSRGFEVNLEARVMANLLIIDDDVDMLSSLSDVLAQAGYQVNGVHSGQAAIDFAATVRPDLVISDVRMAGMDGIQCIKRLSQGRTDLKSIIITGFASDDVPGRAMDLATCDYLCKPFSAEQLIQSVERALSIPLEKPTIDYPPEMLQTGAALSDMEATRKRAFQNFYLGIRSGHLGASSSLNIWDVLEGVEKHYLELKRALQLRTEVTELKDRYLNVSEFCQNPNSAAILGGKRQEGGISRMAFQLFFKNVKAGNISSEQVKQAVRARERAMEPDSQTADEKQLYSLIWT